MAGERLLGGLPVTAYEPSTARLELSRDPPYVFTLARLPAGATADVGAAGAIALYVLDGDLSAAGHYLGMGDALLVENEAVVAHAGASGTRVVIAARGAPSGEARSTLTRAQEIKTVTKPWGHELWLTGEHPLLALKQLFVRQGKKLSLQYHHHKRETLVLTSGRIHLWYKCNADAGNDSVTPADLGQELLSPLAAFDVTPGCLHRIEGIDDATLYEASTPELDDVVRVADDWARPDGRIAAEHGPK